MKKKALITGLAIGAAAVVVGAAVTTGVHNGGFFSVSETSVSDNTVSSEVIELHGIFTGVSQEDVFPAAGDGSAFDIAMENLGEEGEAPTYYGYTNLGIASVDNHLNVRKEPNENGEMVGKMSNGAACEILDVTGNWAHVKSGEIEGYVSLDYLLTGAEAVAKAEEVVRTIATVNTTTLKVREEPNTDCAVITLIPVGEELDVTEMLDGWVKFELDDEEAYVSLEYVDITQKLDTAISMQELYYGNGVSNTRIDLVNFAKRYIGGRYVWGGASLTSGVDCSGFTMKVYQQFGISLPHSSRAQANCGRTVPLSEVRPGDLIFYTRGGTINHVAIYIGNGQVCHASSPSTGIRVSGMYYRTPYKAVSLLP